MYFPPFHQRCPWAHWWRTRRCWFRGAKDIWIGKNVKPPNMTLCFEYADRLKDILYLSSFVLLKWDYFYLWKFVLAVRYLSHFFHLVCLLGPNSRVLEWETCLLHGDLQWHREGWSNGLGLFQGCYGSPSQGTVSSVCSVLFVDGREVVFKSLHVYPKSSCGTMHAL